MNANEQLLREYGFEQTPCGPWRRPVADSNYGEIDYVIVPRDRPGFSTERTGTYPDGDGGYYEDHDRTVAKPGQSFKDFMLEEFGPVPEKKTYTREEVIDLLETLYAQTAEEYNDHGKLAFEYTDDAKNQVAAFMVGR